MWTDTIIARNGESDRVALLEAGLVLAAMSWMACGNFLIGPIIIGTNTVASMSAPPAGETAADASGRYRLPSLWVSYFPTLGAIGVASALALMATERSTLEE